MDTDALIAQLRIDEGLRLRPYKDTRGKTTIGIGRNLDDEGISVDEALALCLNDVKRIAEALNGRFLWWGNLSEARQEALCNMAFNLGVAGLLEFHDMLTAIEAEDYDEAAAQMLNSKWAREVGDRAKRLAIQMKGTAVT